MKNKNKKMVSAKPKTPQKKKKAAQPRVAKKSY